MDVAQLVRLPNKTRRSWVQPFTFHCLYDNQSLRPTHYANPLKSQFWHAWWSVNPHSRASRNGCLATDILENPLDKIDHKPRYVTRQTKEQATRKPCLNDCAPCPPEATVESMLTQQSGIQQEALSPPNQASVTKSHKQPHPDSSNSPDTIVTTSMAFSYSLFNDECCRF